jgi:PRC-barrel domain protein
MAVFDPATLDRWRALAIVDRDGTTVGTISEFYLDRETGHPTWALVNTGLFGTTQTFVPLVQATEIADGLQVPYEKRHIKDTPRVDLHDELSPDEEAALFAHYGVEYGPAAEESADAQATEGALQAVTAGPETAEESASVATGPGAAAAPGSVATEPADGEGPGPVGTDTGAAGEQPGLVPAEPEVTEGPGPVPVEPEVAAAPGAVATEPGAEGPDSVHAEPGATEGPGPVPADPEPDGPASAAEWPEHLTEDDPDLSRTAPVEPGLPGSTAADPHRPGPTTIDKAADSSEPPADEPGRPPEEAVWPPAPTGSFEEQVPLDRPVGSSERWREAKLAAERERIARQSSTPPEERSPLERARRRLERLVGGGQEHTDADDVSPADQDAAERARRARLGFDEDDDRRR